jgi:hypothetical protein
MKYSNLFKDFISTKKLIRHDDMPLSASSPVEQVIILNGKVAELEVALAEANAIIASLKGKKEFPPTEEGEGGEEGKDKKEFPPTEEGEDEEDEVK